MLPFAGVRYNPEHVRLGGVLAPPYDVISDARRDELYGRDLRNIVRIDCGADQAGDAGTQDRYTRAAAFLRSWLELGILIRDPAPGFYVCDHDFSLPDGVVRRRRGLLATVRAGPWDRVDLRPHERTMTGPKQDRLALMRATRTQTSPVFAVWTGAPGIDALLGAAATGRALAGGRIDGEMGTEKLLLWRVSDALSIGRLSEALAGASLYVADGHHRFETAAAYAAERRAAEPDAPEDAAFDRCLVYLSAADDPALTVLPTHRLVRPGPGIAFSLDDLWARLDDAFDAEPAANIASALAAAASIRLTHHAFAVAARDGVAVLRRPRRVDSSPRDSLDVAVLEDEILTPAGVSAAAITGGALGYTRDAAELERAVRGDEAVLGFGVVPVTPAEVVAVADTGETMPHKSTYFYPKVPTGLVLHPV